MTQEQAMNIIKQACASISAPLETHSQMQTAINIIESLLAAKEETEKSSKK